MLSNQDALHVAKTVMSPPGKRFTFRTPDTMYYILLTTSGNRHVRSLQRNKLVDLS